MTTLSYKVPGKVVTNGSYIVLDGESCTVLTINCYLRAEVTHTPSVEPRVVIHTDDTTLTCRYIGKWVCDSTTPASYYLFRIVDGFCSVAGPVSGYVTMRLRFDDGFFVDKSRNKTGIGSSACLVVAIVYGLYVLFGCGRVEPVPRYIECVSDKSGDSKGESRNEGVDSEYESVDDKSGGPEDDTGGNNSSKVTMANSIYTPATHSVEISEKSENKEPRVDAIKEPIQITQELVSLVYTVNKKIAPKASGCDVVSCLVGPVIFNTSSFQKLRSPSEYLILGSDGKSTFTGDMIRNLNLKESKWDRLRALNKLIVDRCVVDRSAVDKSIDEKSAAKKSIDEKSTVGKIVKGLYLEYLEELTSISTRAVPDKQYSVLEKTFDLGIFGCGVSGAGGDDCVWCLCDSPKEVVDFWGKEFSYVKVSEVVSDGLVVE